MEAAAIGRTSNLLKDRNHCTGHSAFKTLFNWAGGMGFALSRKRIRIWDSSGGSTSPASIDMS